MIHRILMLAPCLFCIWLEVSQIIRLMRAGNREAVAGYVTALAWTITAAYWTFRHG